MTSQPELVLPASALTVLAGADEPGFQDGNGDLARFNHPLALAVDNQGYVYIADSSNHAIRKISPQGQVTTLAGSGQKGDIDALGRQASFTFPLTLTVDESGQVFILENIYPRETTADTHEVRADQKNFARRLRKINKEQVVSTLHINSVEILKDALQDIFWHEETKQLYLNSPYSIYSIFRESEVKIVAKKEAFSLKNSGLIEASQTSKELSNRFRVFNYFSELPTLESIFLEKNGNIFVNDIDRKIIWKLGMDNEQPLLFAGGAQFFQYGFFDDGCSYLAGLYGVRGFTQGKTGEFYIIDSKRIRKITPAGCVSSLKIKGVSDSQSGELEMQPIDLAFDQKYNILYFLSGNKVYKLDFNTLVTG